jgi:hypothetical protein
MSTETMNLIELQKYGYKNVKFLALLVRGLGSGHTHTIPVPAYAFKEGNFYIRVTAKSGTNPTLDAKIMTKHPTADEWYQLVAFTQLTDVGKEMKPIAANLGGYLSVEYTIGGTATPTFTFEILGFLKTK